MPYAEGLKYEYWVVMLSLLKKGIPYDVLSELTPTEMYTVISVSSALEERENDEIERQQNLAMNKRSF